MGRQGGGERERENEAGTSPGSKLTNKCQTIDRARTLVYQYCVSVHGSRSREGEGSWSKPEGISELVHQIQR